MSTNGFLWTMRDLEWQARRVLKPGTGHLLAFIDWRMAPNLSAALESADLRQHPMLVWDKTYFGMGGQFRNQHRVHRAHDERSALPRSDGTLGTSSPASPSVVASTPQRSRCRCWSRSYLWCARSVAVVDPFAGSGATGVAALEYGATFLGVEMSEHYAAIAAGRMRSASSRTPSTSAR